MIKSLEAFRAQERRVTKVMKASAETILTLKNRELIHFGYLRRGFVEKELIHDTEINSCIDTRFLFTLYDI